MKLEHRKQKMAPLPHFIMRMGRYAIFAALLIFLSVSIGVLGYHYLGKQAGWIVFTWPV